MSEESVNAPSHWEQPRYRFLLMTLGLVGAQARRHAVQPGGRLRSDWSDSDVANDAKGRDRLHEPHSSTGCGLLDDHVAGQQQTNARL